MQESEASKNPNTQGDRGSPSSIETSELERLVVEAIREHRCLLESDQIAYEEWERAKADPCMPADLVERLEADCLRRQEETATQQDALSELIDRLGFVPRVPGDDLGAVNREAEGRDPSRSRPRE